MSVVKPHYKLFGAGPRASLVLGHAVTELETLPGWGHTRLGARRDGRRQPAAFVDALRLAAISASINRSGTTRRATALLHESMPTR